MRSIAFYRRNMCHSTALVILKGIKHREGAVKGLLRVKKTVNCGMALLKLYSDHSYLDYTNSTFVEISRALTK